jgi:hypothetical protein
VRIDISASEKSAAVSEDVNRFTGSEALIEIRNFVVENPEMSGAYSAILVFLQFYRSHAGFLDSFLRKWRVT